jgi:exo-beta-1,3-glucanase (GH17 family)
MKVKRFVISILVILSAAVFSACAQMSTATPSPKRSLSGNLRLLEEKFSTLCWVAYAPTQFDSTLEEQPLSSHEMSASIREDLRVLYEAGFRGLVTYSASPPADQIPGIARDVGFEGVVVGVWNPNAQEEIDRAASLTASVDGYVVGNEGLHFGRYTFDELVDAMEALRQRTNKPVATTEPWQAYSPGAALLSLGDWIFPNVHPYWAGQREPFWAAHWTVAEFERLRASTAKPLIFKEVGLPTAGASGMSEENQARFFGLLQQTDVRFVYFEGYDAPWKTDAPVEPHWGLFHADRAPKQAAGIVCGKAALPALEPLPTVAPGEAKELPFVIYDEYRENLPFAPSGWMGDVADLTLDMANTSDPHTGQTCIRIDYDSGGAQGWAGIYWQATENNWGDQPGGYDLDGAGALSFWARGAEGGEMVTFGVGGLGGEYRDSLWPARTSGPHKLSAGWREYRIDLHDADLHHIIGGFYVTLGGDPDATGDRIVFLDDIRYIP